MTDLADSEEFAAGVAIGRQLADSAHEAHGKPKPKVTTRVTTRVATRRHLTLVPNPALDAAMRTVADVKATRADELDEWQRHQLAAFTTLGTAAAHATAAHHANLKLRWLPAFGTPGRRDHRPPPTVRISAAAIDNRARLTYFAAHGRHFAAWRRKVRIGTATATVHALDCAEHNHDATRGCWTTHTVTVVRGRYEPTRATLLTLAALLAIGGYGAWLGAVWVAGRVAEIAAEFVGRYAGTALPVVIIAATLVLVRLGRASDKAADGGQ